MSVDDIKAIVSRGPLAAPRGVPRAREADKRKIFEGNARRVFSRLKTPRH